jgi:hypothetical protein
MERRIEAGNLSASMRERRIIRRSGRVVVLFGAAALSMPAYGLARSSLAHSVTESAKLTPVASASAPHPVFNSAQGVAVLNQQRSASGIPGDLVEDATLSAGCLSWATVYLPSKGQYPHEELPGQPGYTELGNQAAASSDLAGEAGGRPGNGTVWKGSTNAWMDAPIHEAALWNPESTMAWYGASSSAVCVGTGGSRAFPAPAFFSLPGPGATNVPTAVTVSELQFTPEMGVGLAGIGVGGRGLATYLAPPILLWAEGQTRTPSLKTAALRTSDGRQVPIKLVTPDTPAPASPPNFPQVSTYGALTKANFVLPTVKFSPRTSYVLTATWEALNGPPATQSVQFTTGNTDFNGQLQEAERAELYAGASTGLLTVTLNPHGMTLVATGLDIGRTVTATIEPCGRFDCFTPHPWLRHIHLTSARVRALIPMPRRGHRALMSIFGRPFTLNGHTYNSESMSFQIFPTRVSR